MMSQILFIYGTLHPDRAPARIADAARSLTPLGRATIQGRRYELGEFPGVVFTSNPAERVAGELFLLPVGTDGSKVLARLDDYEDFRPGDPEGSLFLRQTTMTLLEDGSQRQCWIYTYNQPLP